MERNVMERNVMGWNVMGWNGRGWDGMDVCIHVCMYVPNHMTVDGSIERDCQTH